MNEETSAVPTSHNFSINSVHSYSDSNQAIHNASAKSSVVDEFVPADSVLLDLPEPSSA